MERLPHNIQPETSKITMDDSGLPSENAVEDILRVLRLGADERYIVAYELYLDVQKRIQQWKQTSESSVNDDASTICSVSRPRMENYYTYENELGSSSGLDKIKKTSKTTFFTKRRLKKYDLERKEALSKQFEEVSKIIEDKTRELEKIIHLAEIFIVAEESLSSDDEWIHSQTFSGISTYYRREDDGTLSLKIEGEMKGLPVFEQIAVLRETDLYHTWAPFCSNSKMIRKLGPVDNLSWYNCSSPFMINRDVLFRSVGCDCVKESGRILIVATGIEDKKIIKKEKEEAKRLRLERKSSFDHLSYLKNIPSDIETPKRPTKFGHERVELRCFQGIIEVLSPTSGRTQLFANLDPNFESIPQWLIEFVLKKMVGVLLVSLQKAARKAIESPVKNPHAKRMRREKKFYDEWLYPKFQAYCDQVNWELPLVSAFNVDDEVLIKEGEFDGTFNNDTCSTFSEHNGNRSCAYSTISTMSNGSFSVKSLKLKSPATIVREHKQRKKEKKLRSIESVKRRQELRNIPKKKSVRDLNRIATLKKIKGKSNASLIRTKNYKTSFRALPHHPVIVLALMIFLFYGDYPCYKVGSTVYSLNTWKQQIMIVLEVLMVHLIYGLCHSIVIWSSLLVIFDSLEQAAATFNVLNGGRKFFSKYALFIVIAFTTCISALSLTNASLRCFGRYLNFFAHHALQVKGMDEVATNNALDSVYEILSSAGRKLNTSFPNNLHELKLNSLQVFNASRYFLFNGWNSSNDIYDILEDGRFHLNREVFINVGIFMFDIVMYFFTLCYVVAAVVTNKMRRNLEKYSFELISFFSGTVDSGGVTPWHEITIISTSYWMVYSATCLVFLEIALSFLLKKKSIDEMLMESISDLTIGSSLSVHDIDSDSVPQLEEVNSNFILGSSSSLNVIPEAEPSSMQFDTTLVGDGNNQKCTNDKLKQHNQLKRRISGTRR